MLLIVLYYKALCGHIILRLQVPSVGETGRAAYYLCGLKVPVVIISNRDVLCWAGPKSEGLGSVASDGLELLWA